MLEQEDFEALATEHHASSCQFFDQAEYLEIFQGQRVRSFSSSRQFSYGSNNFDAEAGVCFGIVLKLIQCKFLLDQLANSIDSPKFIGEIRGFTHAQSLMSCTKAGKWFETEEEKKAYTGNDMMAAQFDNSDALIPLLLAKTHTMVAKRPPQKRSLVLAAEDLSKYQRSYISLGVGSETSDSGHEVAMKFGRTQFAYFDPNFGIATFSRVASRGRSSRGAGVSAQQMHGKVTTLPQFLQFVEKAITHLYEGEIGGNYSYVVLRELNPANVSPALTRRAIGSR